MAEREDIILETPDEEPNFSDPEDFVDDVTDEGNEIQSFPNKNV